VIIAGAGGAAHLAGVIAAETTLPVIGVPIPSTSLQGLDSLLAIVQMPAGIPVATVAIGKPGATNAGILAAQIIAAADQAVAEKMKAHKQKLARGVEEKSRKLKEQQKAS
jgi:phosphoribosylaminoimidazole carboxylase PurE protein